MGEFPARRPTPFRAMAGVATVSSLFTVAVAAVVDWGLPSPILLVVAMALVWLYLMGIAAFAARSVGQGKPVIRIMPDSLRLVAGTWTLLSIPWVDVEVISQVPVTRLPLLRRITAWVTGGPSGTVARIRLRRMIRLPFVGVRITTRTFGWPGFTRDVYLAPDDIDGFVEAVRSRLAQPA